MTSDEAEMVAAEMLGAAKDSEPTVMCKCGHAFYGVAHDKDPQSTIVAHLLSAHEPLSREG